MKAIVIAQSSPALQVTYTNWRGQTRERRLLPMSIWFGSTEWHPEQQWLMKAIDQEINEVREFAMRDMVPAGCAVLKDTKQ